MRVDDQGVEFAENDLELVKLTKDNKFVDDSYLEGDRASLVLIMDLLDAYEATEQDTVKLGP